MQNTSPVAASSAPLLGRLQKVLDTSIGRLGNLGGVIAMQLPDQAPIVLTAGFADLERTQPVRPDSVVMIASQSKTFTCIAALRLIRDGRLRLDQPVVELLGAGLGLSPAVTIEHLMTSRSGLGEYEAIMFGKGYPGDVHLQPSEVFNLCRLAGHRFSPGKQFDYANVNFLMLAMVVQAVTGVPFADHVQSTILDPLELEMWLATSEPLPRARMASGYFTSASRPDPVHAADIDYSVAFGTGDIASDLVTMVRFWRALLDPSNPTGITVADLTADMGFASNTPFHPASLGVQYGYGVEVAHWAGRRVVGHPGSIQGYRSGSWIDPELGIAISLCITSVQDLTEDPLIAGRRYPGPQLYTAALGTAYAMHDLINGEFAPA